MKWPLCLLTLVLLAYVVSSYVLYFKERQRLTHHICIQAAYNQYLTQATNNQKQNIKLKAILDTSIAWCDSNF